MTWPIRSIVLYLGLPVLSVCALSLYLWQKKEEEEWSEMIRGLNLIERELKVPQNVVADLVGRGGIQLKELQEKTSTKIHFRDGGYHLDHTVVKITGKEDNVSQAIALVTEVINSQANFKTFEMWIPQSSCGRIIGRCGDTIRSICKTSGARLNIDNKSQDVIKRLLTIRGTDDQIKAAVSLVEEKVKEDEAARTKLHLTLSNRSPRGQMCNENGSDTPKPDFERLIATTGESMLQVYVSAVATPVHFWLQVLTSRAADLDTLLDDMTEYYSKEENREPLDIEKVEKGQIVACLMSDTKWYRVEICKVETRADPVEDTMVDVFYVDYGESEFIPLKHLCHLRSDFLCLRFQAIEVRMVGVVPVEGDAWPEDATECFEDLTYCGQWKALVAEVVGYKKRKGDSPRSGSPIACVKLYDPDGPPGVDLGMQLIQKGLAKKADAEEMSPHYEVHYKSDTLEESW